MSEKSFPQTPSEFYRQRRPEFFSDSQKVQEVKLPKEQLEFELSQITINQKEAAFETFGRRLAEKLITPNLIPQVGPTGGGDGKTDSETYPVSETISDRWFVPENGWTKGENWAIAISAKKDWKPKIKSDVKSIIGTGRGYTKIYFISNQTISSKNKKDTQDELKKEFGIEVTILDTVWIVESVYTNDLINLVVDSLNLSSVYKETTKIGSNDAIRIDLLKELEEKISDTRRYFEYDYQLVEDALQAAILTRMLEKPKSEVLGKFDRALRLGQKVNNYQQLTRIHYQRAWTLLQWYDDYSGFLGEFNSFKEHAIKDANISILELYFNLLNLIRGINVSTETIADVDFQKNESQYIDILDKCIEDTSKPTRSLTARTYKLLLEILQSFNDASSVSKILSELKHCFEESRTFFEYPFDNFKEAVEIYGDLLPENKEYDNLIDFVADITENRVSEVSSGEIFFKRAYQKLSNGYDRESLIYFGKSVKKLAKEESQDYLYFALRGLSQAYRNLGLLWASNISIVAASSIALKEFYNEGKLNMRSCRCAEDALKNESFLGRIPYLLSWFELFKVITLHIEAQEPEEGDMPTSNLVDACLSVRLLNSSFDLWNSFSSLPEIFKTQELCLSEDTALYALGYYEKIDKDNLIFSSTPSIDEYYNKVAYQPFKDQIIYETNLLENEKNEFKSIILGTEFIVGFKQNKEHAIFAETMLGFFESFLATAFNEIFPFTEIIKIYLEESDVENYIIIEDNSRKSYTVKFTRMHIIDNNNLNTFLLELLTKILPSNFIIRDGKEYLVKLFGKEEVHERISFITTYRIFFKNIFGDHPKIFLNDWIAKNEINQYKLKRTSNPINISKDENKNSASDKTTELEDMKHNHAKVFSIVDTHLWDKAHWKAFGLIVTPAIPLGIFLAFENEENGKQIFKDWITKLGKVDTNEIIKITIVKGVNVDNPFWYKVLISKDVDLDAIKTSQFYISASRNHLMNPTNDVNLTNLIKEFNYYKKYVLFPATYTSDGKLIPHMDLGITKTKLTIKDAWEIGENDLESVVITKDDKPIIPSNKIDVPIVNLLKKRGFARS